MYRRYILLEFGSYTAWLQQALHLITLFICALPASIVLVMLLNYFELMEVEDTWLEVARYYPTVCLFVLIGFLRNYFARRARERMRIHTMKNLDTFYF